MQWTRKTTIDHQLMESHLNMDEWSCWIPGLSLERLHRLHTDIQNERWESWSLNPEHFDIFKYYFQIFRITRQDMLNWGSLPSPKKWTFVTGHFGSVLVDLQDAGVTPSKISGQRMYLNWLAVSNMDFIFPFSWESYGMSSSQLTFIFFRWVDTTNQEKIDPGLIFSFSPPVMRVPDQPKGQPHRFLKLGSWFGWRC